MKKKLHILSLLEEFLDFEFSRLNSKLKIKRSRRKPIRKKRVVLGLVLKIPEETQKEGSERFLYGESFELNWIETQEKSGSTSFEICREEKILRISRHGKKSIKLIQKEFEDYLTLELIGHTKKDFEKWERELEVKNSKLTIKKMISRWGYCHIIDKRICLNLLLITQNEKFIEYVVLHELAHLLVPNHGVKFKEILNQKMPEWKEIKNLAFIHFKDD